MRLITLFTIALLASGCAGTYKPTFPSTETAGGSERLYVQPVLLQEELAVQVVVADSSAATAQYGALGALVGAIVDSAINNSRAKKAERNAEVLREATADYRIVESFAAAVATDASGSGWEIVRTGAVSGETDTRDMVEAIFDTSDVDAVMVLNGTYQLLPTLDKVSVGIDQSIYRRPDESTTRLRPDNTRVFQYESPTSVVEYRGFVPGEKDLLRQEITQEYEQTIATQPEEEKDLRKALEKELEELDESETIPEHVAIREAWPTDLLVDYMEQARSHLRYMVEFDWNERVVPETDKEALEEFYYTNAMGVRIKAKGRRVGELDANAVYRTPVGTMVSVSLLEPVE